MIIRHATLLHQINIVLVLSINLKKQVFLEEIKRLETISEINENILLKNQNKYKISTYKNIGSVFESYAQASILGNMKDESVAIVSFPSEFPYFGKNFGKVVVTSNGLLHFTLSDNSSFCCVGKSMIDSSVPHNAIAAFWVDLFVDLDSAIYYSVIDGSLDFTIIFYNVKAFFQSKLCTATIECVFFMSGEMYINIVSNSIGNNVNCRGANVSIGFKGSADDGGQQLVAVGTSNIPNRILFQITPVN